MLGVAGGGASSAAGIAVFGNGDAALFCLGAVLGDGRATVGVIARAATVLDGDGDSSATSSAIVRAAAVLGGQGATAGVIAGAAAVLGGDSVVGATAGVIAGAADVRCLMWLVGGEHSSINKMKQ